MLPRFGLLKAVLIREYLCIFSTSALKFFSCRRNLRKYPSNFPIAPHIALSHIFHTDPASLSMFLYVLCDTSYGDQWSLVCLALDWAFEKGRSWKKLSTLRETVLPFLLEEDDWKTFLITLENALWTGCNEHVPGLKKVVFISSRYFAIFFLKLALVLGLDHPS